MFSERKRKKRHLSIVVKKFNSKPFGKEWIREGVELEIFVEPVMPRSIAQFLRSAPNLDKTQIGEYISKGPPEKYPFHSGKLSIIVPPIENVSLMYSFEIFVFFFSILIF